MGHVKFSLDAENERDKFRAWSLMTIDERELDMGSMTWNHEKYGKIHLLVDAEGKTAELVSEKEYRRRFREAKTGTYTVDDSVFLLRALNNLTEQGFEIIRSMYTPEELRGRTDLVPELMSDRFAQPYICMLRPYEKKAPVKKVAPSSLSKADIMRLLDEQEIAPPAKRRKSK